ncbi:MAG: pyridoxal phosphate-dependent aminotransferase [Candidatus Pacebacteria bacterium]|nr:pyridoxal phosphate-dependent aminotransferase [Candidatus Paceibacterota bacterium]
MNYSSVTGRLATLGSAKWEVHFTARAMAAAGESILEMTIGEPDIPPDPRLLEQVTRSLNSGRISYASGRCEPVLARALTEKYRKYRPTVTERNFLALPGAQTCLYTVIMAIAEAGDAILVGDPYYATYEGIIRASGAEPIFVPLRPENGFHMKAADLEAVITPKCRAVLINTPHNPTGAVLSAAEIAAIGQVCLRHNLWLISDEVYADMVYEGQFVTPFANPDLAEIVLSIGSVSKSFAAPGLRSGWVAAPEEFVDRCQPLAEAMLFGNQPFIADATAWGIANQLTTGREFGSHCLRRARLVEEALEGCNLLRLHRPEAGMFVLVDIGQTGMTSHNFAMALLQQERVAVMPGSSFGANLEGYLRLSLTTPDEVILEACQRLRNFAGRIRGR